MPSLSKAGAFILLAVASLTIMVGCVIVPGLPAIADALGVPHAAAWLVTVPSLGVVLLGPLVARLSERLGLYRTLCIGLFAYGLLGAGGMWLHGAPLIFADRLLLGAATAAVMASGTGLISQFYRGPARLAMIAKQGMAIELGGVLFLACAGWLASQAWQAPFTLYLLAWLLLACVLMLIRDPGPAIADAQAEAGFSAGLRVVYGSALAAMVVFFAAIIALPISLHARGVSETATGNFLSGVSLVAVLAAALMPRVSGRLGEHGTLALAFLAFAMAHGLFAAAQSLPIYLLGGLCLGAGFGWSVPLLNHMTVEQSAPALRGRHLAFLSMALFSGQFLSALLDLLPGGGRTLYLAAASVAVIAAVTLFREQRKGRNVTLLNQN
ncbi:MFS transporter [Pseudomonas putida]